jgi:hypothetical protein
MDTFGPMILRNGKFNNSDNVMVKMYNDRTTVRKEHKIVIIGNSHSRGYTTEVTNQPTNKFEVISLVKPGVSCEVLEKSAMSDMVNLTKSDIVVFCGGSSEVSKNNSNIALKDVLYFIKDNNNTNIILLSVPHRHDLMDSFCVNNGIRTFNRKLMEVYKNC